MWLLRGKYFLSREQKRNRLTSRLTGIAWPLIDLAAIAYPQLRQKKPPFKTGHLNTVLGEDDGKRKHYLFSFNILIIWQNTKWGDTKFRKCFGLSFFSITNILSLVLSWVCHPTIPKVRTNPRKSKSSLAALFDRFQKVQTKLLRSVVNIFHNEVWKNWCL